MKKSLLIAAFGLACAASGAHAQLGIGAGAGATLGTASGFSSFGAGVGTGGIGAGATVDTPTVGASGSARAATPDVNATKQGAKNTATKNLHQLQERRDRIEARTDRAVDEGVGGL